MPFLLTYVDVKAVKFVPTCWILIGQFKFQSRKPYARNFSQNGSIKIVCISCFPLVFLILNYGYLQATLDLLQKNAWKFEFFPAKDCNSVSIVTHSTGAKQHCLLVIPESLRRTPTDTLDISGRTSSRGMRRGSLRPNIKTKVSGNLSPTGSNPTGNKLPVGRRRSTANRRS